MERKCAISLINTLATEHNRLNPVTNNRYNKITHKSAGSNKKTFKLKKIKRGRRKSSPMQKFKKLANTTDITTNSLGKELCFKIEEWTKKATVASNNVLEKKAHGIMPARIKKA
jgi:hypothetical protein